MATTWTEHKQRAIMPAVDLTPAGDRGFGRAIQVSEQWNASLTPPSHPEPFVSEPRQASAWMDAWIVTHEPIARR
jgi:hypothetical protein